MKEELLRKWVRNILVEQASSSVLTVQPTPDLTTFAKLSTAIIGNSKTVSSDINEIVGAAHVNKGSDVTFNDAMNFAKGGSAAAALQSRFDEILSRATAVGLSATDASSYIAGEIARGNAMGAAALADSGGGTAYWTADRGASLSDFVGKGESVSPPNNPIDFLVQRADGSSIGYSAKSTAGAAGNFSNLGLKPIEDLAGYTTGEARGKRANEVAAIYSAGDKKMEKQVPGFLSLTQSNKKPYRELAKDLDLYNEVQGGVRDLLFDGINANANQKQLNEFVRAVVADLPNPAYKVLYATGLTKGVLKPPTGTGATAIHFATLGATISLIKSGNNGITFNSSGAGKLFTYRIKFVGGYGTSLKSAVIGEAREKNESLIRLVIRETLLLEELTKSDKKEIDRLIKKGIEKDRVAQKKARQKDLETELKKSLGKSFFRQPGMIRKTIEDVCREELAKEMKKGSGLEKSVVDVTKKVLAAWHELIYKQKHIIQRVKI